MRLPHGFACICFAEIIGQTTKNPSLEAKSIMATALLKTSVPGVELFRRGKVRDVYALDDKLLIVATDRISAFAVVLPSAIPYKGAVLTALSIFWFDFLKDTVQNHFITADIGDYPAPLGEYADQIVGRSMLVKRVDVVPIECVARGYLVGSGWKEYKKTGEVCGIKLPAGLRESDQLPEPIFTPSTKAEVGHDVNISEQQMADIVGKELTERLGRMTLDIYEKA